MEDYEAKRSSKYHQKGDIYKRPATVTSALYAKYVRERVFPAIRKKMWWASEVTLQYDGARPHTGHSNQALLSQQRCDSSPKIKMLLQPPQSPDFNCNDLGFFHSLGCLVNKAQLNASVEDVDHLLSSVLQEWRNYDHDTMSRIWKLKSRVLQLAIDHEESNDFKLPHSNK